MEDANQENAYRGACWNVADEQSRLFNQEHPLLNELVLGKIFGYKNINIEDLKNIRLVWKLWNDLIHQKWRHTATIKIIKAKEVFTSLPPQNGILACEFLARVEDPSDPFKLKEIPFTRYKFVDIQIDLGQQDENPMSKYFWTVLGPHMKYLHLEKCSIRTTVAIVVVAVEKLVLDKAVNLEELVLTNTFKIEERLEFQQREIATLLEEHPKMISKLKRLRVHGKVSPFRFPEVLRCSPHLEQLELGHLDDLNDGLWQAILISRRNTGGKFCNLQQVDLIHISNAMPEMGDFYAAQLPLKVLRIQLTTSDDKTDFTTKLLPAYSHSLQKLEVFCPIIICQANMVIPPVFMVNMTNLKELRLWGPVVDNLCFLQFMPNLKSLWIKLLCVEKWDEVQSAIRQGHSDGDFNTYVSPLTMDIVANTHALGASGITNVEHFHIDYEFAVNSLQLLANWMPKLTKLEAVLNGNTFVAVCSQWPNLKQLRCLPGSIIDDNVIIGRRPQGDDISGPLPGIKDFRYLTSFQLDTFCGEAKLTDESLANGFLNMLRLDILEICVSPQMSERAETLLKQTIRHVRLLRMDTNDLSKNSAHKKVCNACKIQNNITFRSSTILQNSTFIHDSGFPAIFSIYRFYNDGKGGVCGHGFRKGCFKLYRGDDTMRWIVPRGSTKCYSAT